MKIVTASKASEKTETGSLTRCQWECNYHSHWEVVGFLKTQHACYTLDPNCPPLAHMLRVGPQHVVLTTAVEALRVGA